MIANGIEAGWTAGLVGTHISKGVESQALLMAAQTTLLLDIKFHGLFF